MKFSYNEIGPVVLEEKSFESVDGLRLHRCRASLCYKIPQESLVEVS